MKRDAAPGDETYRGNDSACLSPRQVHNAPPAAERGEEDESEQDESDEELETDDEGAEDARAGEAEDHDNVLRALSEIRKVCATILSPGASRAD